MEDRGFEPLRRLNDLIVFETTLLDLLSNLP